MPFDPAGLDALTGTYVDAFNVGETTVTRVGDALEIAAPTLEEYQIPYEHTLQAVTTRVWLATIQGQQLDLAFIDGPDGETYLRNHAFVAIRPGPTTKPIRRARRPDGAALQWLMMETLFMTQPRHTRGSLPSPVPPPSRSEVSDSAG